MNEADTRYHLIDPMLRGKGYVSRDQVTLETVLTPPPVEPSGPKGRRRRGPGRTDYLLCVQVGDAPKPLPVAVLEAKKEAEDPLKSMQQARGYADTLRFDVKYVFSTNGHRYGEYDRFTELINGPFQFGDFPSHPDLTARYCNDTGIDLTRPESAMLFQADSAAWSQNRYYQDAAIRATFEKILLDRQAGKPPRALLTLATGAGKTIIATNLLWRLSQAGQLPTPALFLCDRDELREQAYTRLKAAFGDNARIVTTERGGNAAANARIHIATYQTLGLDDEDGFASFLTDHYGEDAFSVIVIDECHRSAWGRWSEVLRRNPTKDEYTGKDFDDELFIELRTPTMCADLFQLLCEHGGPEQKVIIFCTREIHADRVAQRMNNLYVRWCKERGRTPKDHDAFKCMGGANNGADMIEPMRGSGERAFIACTVDLLEAGVDIERLNAVVFFRYLQSPIKFYQMVGRGTRIHEETRKYKFWLYDYTGVTSLFGTDFISKPPRPGGAGQDDGGDTGGGGEGGDDPVVAEIHDQYVVINPQGRFILVQRAGRDTLIPVDEYRREVIQRVIAEAHNLDEFRAIWIETQRRRSLIDRLLGETSAPR
jgi:type I site-specific restriction endonuclease